MYSYSASRPTRRFPTSSLALAVVAIAVLQLDRPPCLAGDTCDLGFASADTAHDPLLAGGSQLGWAIAVLGDVTGDGTADFAGGAPLALGRGQAIVFSGADRSVACRIEHPQPTQTDRFGRAVAGGADLDVDGVPDLVVAAPLDDDRGVDSGTLLVFSGADCGYRMTIADPAGEAGDGLGSALTLVPDLDGDGVSDIVAGAPLADAQGADAGSIVVFSGLTGLRIVQLLDPEGAPGDKLGSSVAALPDVTGDGVPEIAAGAPSSSSIEIGSGSVVVFSGADGTVVRRMVDAQGGALDALGTSIAASADLDGDGFAELLAGVPGDDTARGANAGSVVAFSGATGGALFKLTDPISLPGDALGTRVVGLADLTFDGVPDVAAAATGVDIGGALGVGRLTIFSGLDGTVALRFADPNGAAGDELGLDLAVIDDVAGDGALEIAAGSRFDDEGGQPNVGSIKVFAFEADCDGDGFSPRGGDCDDLDPARHPGVPDLCNDLDDDCDGQADEAGDCDGDGVTPLGGDCDDTDAGAFPGAPEVCDGVDNDCDGVIDEYLADQETCDGQDNDCDGAVDEDSDGDGFDVCEEEAACHVNLVPPDNDAFVYPGAPELCDGADNDCDGTVDEGEDADEDGSSLPCDCRDDDPTVHPGATDTCNHRDDDCDGAWDEGSVQRLSSGRFRDPSSMTEDMGAALANIGDIDGDGVPDVAVGAPRAPDATQPGKVTLFSGANRSILCRIGHPLPQALDRFGAAVAGDEDLDADGIPDVVIAAPLDDDRGANSGSLLVFSGAGCHYLRTILDPAGAPFDELGAALALLPDVDGDGVAEIVAGAPKADVGPRLDAGSVVVFSGRTGSLLYRLLDPDGEANDGLGTSVTSLGDVTGDGVADIAAGAPFGAAPSSPNAGAVLLFSGADGRPVRRLVAPSPGNEDQFGFSVAALGDLDGDRAPEIAVGAPFDDLQIGADQGSVAVFSGRTGTLILQLLGDQPDRPQFGWRVASFPDLTGDGKPDIAVSIPGLDTVAAVDRGAVNVYSSLSGTLRETLYDVQGRANDRFGASLAVLGDMSGDGQPEIGIGVPGDDAFMTDSGSVAVFALESDCDRDFFGPFAGDCNDTDPRVFPGAPEICDGTDSDCDGRLDDVPGGPETCDGLDNDCDGVTDEDGDVDGFTVCQEEALCPGVTAPDADRNIHPGALEFCDQKDNDCNGAVDDGPDGDGDGFAVCDCRDYDPAVHPGALETCDHSDQDCDGRVDEDTTLALSRKLIDPHSLSLDQLGYSVTGLGDVTGDGVPDFAAGVPFDVSSDQSGRVVVYSGADLSIHCRFFHPQPTSGDVFGQALAGGRDLDADGVPDLVVGTPLADDRGLNSGALHVYSGAGCAWLRTLADPDGTDGDQLGLSVALIDDLDGDGVAEIAGGAYRDDTARGIDAGSVVVFSGRTGAPLWKLEDPSGLADARLGVAVAGAPDVTGDGVPDVLVGAYNDPAGGATAGSLVVFSGATGLRERKLIDPGRAAGDQLGVSVAVSADLDGDAYPDLLGGAYLDDTAQGVDAGSVVVFSGNTGAFLRKLTDPQGEAGDLLGFRVVGFPDFDGDGRPEVIATSPVGNTPRGIDAGRVTVFSGTNGTVVERFIDPVGAAADRLGVSLAVTGDLSGDGTPEVVAGARADDELGLENVGSVLLFIRDSDCDADGHTPYQGDCRDDDPALWRTPGEARNLRFTSTTDLAWDAPVEAGGPAQAYDVVRSDEAQIFASAVCVESDDGADRLATDTEVPPPGLAWFYLVRADGTCGSGSLGESSTGESRAAPPCP